MASLTVHFATAASDDSGESDADPPRPVLGFFGDHWQQIYPGTCGAITSDALVRIEKGANFRSAPAIIDVLNRMRPALPQVPDREIAGEVAVFPTNDWSVTRQSSGQWKGDLTQPTHGPRSTKCVSISHFHA
jgi:DNA helicase II / ATP-dependent DNA helicase PcrA